jgi:hypothetical protein
VKGNLNSHYHQHYYNNSYFNLQTKFANSSFSCKSSVLSLETNTAQIVLEIRHLAYRAHQQPQAAESRVPPLFQSRTENPRITQILPAAATAVAGGDLNTEQLATYRQLARVNN